MREDVQAGYDKVAEDYAATGGSSASKPFLEDLDNRIEDGARILDVGCGDGTPALNHFVGQFDAIGLDISREQLRLAATIVPGTPLIQGEMTALPVGRSIIDAVVGLYSIIHVPRADHQVVFEEWARVLRPGGWVLFSSGTEGWAGRNPDWLDSGVEMVWSYPGPDDTITALEAAGFELVATDTVPDSLADDGEKQFFLARLADRG